MDSLRTGGCERVIASPGSRSTPLALAALDAGLSLHTIIDERSAAFFALGLVRATRKPVALLCTSGSAAGHYLPAVMEASADAQPLVVISSDRPPELQGSGANQTTDQNRLFGNHVRTFLDLGAAVESDAALRGVMRRCRKVMIDATFPHAGPVHINVPLRKPLEGRSEAPSVVQPRVFIPEGGAASDDALDAIGELLARGERPAIVAGPASLGQIALRQPARRLADCLGAPILADLTSQLHGLPFLDCFDPDVILQLGRPPIDSAWDAWSSSRKRVVITPGPWYDPGSNADLIAFGALHGFVKRLADGLRERPPWCAEFSENVAEVLGGVEQTTLGHASVARLFSEAVPRNGLLMAGNSLSVRNLDLFGSRRTPGVLHQRGLSGIDGLVAGAAGASAAGYPVGLMLGDISLLHDIKSLDLTPPGATLVVVVLNDRGGRIFERLPVAQDIERSVFEEHFTTTHTADFEKAAAAFGAEYSCPTDNESFDRALRKGFRTTGTTLIEVQLPKDSDARTRTALRGALKVLQG
ncbi:MAG: 2-succinyl-5-enolpyruvyl-6-hydroxy-3-cyclohexene-1-carboxylate synthase [Polyangiales bacterium]|jgi:2-succinyl-5-enolpyruvyl-6-hydroxy-3-cyclohexene-1-carboxylate synthase